ncbi:hydroxymethylglutaryl-CoA synthase [Streptomyces gobiensis]|uniref:hydroxymethylglutaryl-CoA synthase n=1 Tax=Streptomyces gobiensis TaxID=2875706 RepID=UPI001E29F945|nr:hydroxymethylglutaryl-CoA synthase [Streptomyces gobiensis]UGY94134.1 hydroxymethylglutaryl-CoA synthase [Streptomyces gobiensis]
MNGRVSDATASTASSASTADAGISGIGVALPTGRLAVEEIHQVWGNQPLEVVHRQGLTHRSVCDPDGDAVTLAAEAARLALDSADCAPPGAVFFGSQTGPYLTKASAALLVDMAGLPPSTFATDVQFSGKSGTAALLCALAWVRAGLAPSALAVGADTLGPHIAPGDPQEYTAGSGAAAVVITREAALATVDATASATSDTNDGFRADGERHIRTGGTVMTATGIGLMAHCTSAWEGLDSTPEQLRFLIGPQPDAVTPARLAQRLGLPKERATACVVAQGIGDVGAAAPLIGLARALELADPGDRLAVVSYGCGAGSDALLLTVRRPATGTGLAGALTVQRQLSYATAARYERHFQGLERLVGSYE